LFRRRRIITGHPATYSGQASIYERRRGLDFTLRANSEVGPRPTVKERSWTVNGGL